MRKHATTKVKISEEMARVAKFPFQQKCLRALIVLNKKHWCNFQETNFRVLYDYNLSQ